MILGEGSFHLALGPMGDWLEWTNAKSHGIGHRKRSSRLAIALVGTLRHAFEIPNGQDLTTNRSSPEGATGCCLVLEQSYRYGIISSPSIHSSRYADGSLGPARCQEPVRIMHVETGIQYGASIC
jgi:hypothetical protein